MPNAKKNCLTCKWEPEWETSSHGDLFSAGCKAVPEIDPSVMFPNGIPVGYSYSVPQLYILDGKPERVCYSYIYLVGYGEVANCPAHQLKD